MCDITANGETLTTLLVGEIDHHSAVPLRAQIDEAIELYRPKLLVLDFGGVSFMDSSGIGLVMGRYKLIAAFGGTIRLAHIPQPLQKVMRLAGLERLAAITEGWEERL